MAGKETGADARAKVILEGELDLSRADEQLKNFEQGRKVKVDAEVQAGQKINQRGRLKADIDPVFDGKALVAQVRAALKDQVFVLKIDEAALAAQIQRVLEQTFTIKLQGQAVAGTGAPSAGAIGTPQQQATAVSREFGAEVRKALQQELSRKGGSLSSDVTLLHNIIRDAATSSGQSFGRGSTLNSQFEETLNKFADIVEAVGPLGQGEPGRQAFSAAIESRFPGTRTELEATGIVKQLQATQGAFGATFREWVQKNPLPVAVNQVTPVAAQPIGQKTAEEVAKPRQTPDQVRLAKENLSKLPGSGIDELAKTLIDALVQRTINEPKLPGGPVVSEGVIGDLGAGGTFVRPQRGQAPPATRRTPGQQARGGRGLENLPPIPTVTDIAEFDALGRPAGESGLETVLKRGRGIGKVVGRSLAESQGRGRRRQAGLSDFATLLSEALAAAQPEGTTRVPTVEDFLAIVRSGFFDLQAKETTKAGGELFKTVQPGSPEEELLRSGRRYSVAGGTAQRMSNEDVLRVAGQIMPGMGITEEGIAEARRAYRAAPLPGQILAPGTAGRLYGGPAGQTAANASLLESYQRGQLTPQETQLVAEQERMAGEENRARIETGFGLGPADIERRQRAEGRQRAMADIAALVPGYSNEAIEAALQKIEAFDRITAQSNEPLKAFEQFPTAADFNAGRVPEKNILAPRKNVGGQPTTVSELIDQITDEMLGEFKEQLPPTAIKSIRGQLRSSLFNVVNPRIAGESVREADVRRGELLNQFGPSRQTSELGGQQTRPRRGQDLMNLSPGSRRFLQTEGRRQLRTPKTELDKQIDAALAAEGDLEREYQGRIKAAEERAMKRTGGYMALEPGKTTGAELTFPSNTDRARYEAIMARAKRQIQRQSPSGERARLGALRKEGESFLKSQGDVGSFADIEALKQRAQGAGLSPEALQHVMERIGFGLSGVYGDLGSRQREVPTGDAVRRRASRIGIMGQRGVGGGGGRRGGGGGGADTPPPQDNRPSIGGPFDVRVINFQDLASMLGRNLGPEVASGGGRARKQLGQADAQAAVAAQVAARGNQGGRIGLIPTPGIARGTFEQRQQEAIERTQSMASQRAFAAAESQRVGRLGGIGKFFDQAEKLTTQFFDRQTRELAAEEAKAAKPPPRQRFNLKNIDLAGFYQDQADTQLEAIRADLRAAQRSTPKRGFTASITDLITARLGGEGFERQLGFLGRAEREASEIQTLTRRQADLRTRRQLLVTEARGLRPEDPRRSAAISEARTVNRDLVGLSKAIQRSESAFGVAIKGATNLGTVLGSFGAAAVGSAVSAAIGSVTFGLGLAVTGPLISGIGEGLTAAIAPMINRMTGFSETVGQTQAALSANVNAVYGNTEAVLGSAAAQSRLNAAALDFVEGPLGRRAEVTAATQAFAARGDLVRTGFAAEEQQNLGFDRALTRGTGGLFDIRLPEILSKNLFAGLIQDITVGGQASFAETLAGRIKDISSPEQLAQEQLFGRDPFTQFGDLVDGGKRLEGVIKDGIASSDKKLEELNAEFKDSGYTLVRTTEGLGDQLKTFTEAQANSLGEALAKSSLKVVGPDGKPLADVTDVLTYLDELTKATPVDVQQLLKETRQQRQAQIAGENAGLRQQVAEVIPSRLGISRTLSPLGDLAAPLKALGISDIGDLPDLLAQVNAQAAQGAAQATSFVGTYLGNNVGQQFADSLQEAQGYAERISAIQIDIQTRQAAYQAHQYAEQIRIATRSLQDAKGLAQDSTATNKDNLGVIQRQTYELQRQSQALSLGQSQRQINFQKALAGFEVPGLTPEEQAARVKQAQIEADYAQKQLNIQKEMFGLSGKGFEISVSRALIDATNQLGLLAEGQEITFKTALGEKQIAALSALMEKPRANIEATFSLAEKRAGDILKLATDIAGVTGQALADVGSDVLKEFRIRYTQMMNIIYGGGGGGGEPSGKKQEFASGTISEVSGATPFIAGEAGPETVIVLRNARNVTPSFGGGSGGGSVTINIDARGAIIDETALARWKEDIVREVNRSMGTTASLLGARLS